MPDSVTVSYRGIAMEDFLTSDTPDQVSQVVLGVGAVDLTPFVVAAGDAAALSAGVDLGQVYMDSSVSPNRLKARMT